MPVYTVHAPEGADATPRNGADSFVFIRDGFAFWAFVFGPLWLLSHRLWLALMGYIAFSIAGEVVLLVFHVGAGARLLVMLLVAVLLGLEAASLRRWTLSRRNWRQIDVVVADDEEAAERRFFDRWTSKQRGLVNDQAAVDRGAPPPTREVPGQPFSRPLAPHDIIGLFPQPGGMPR